MPHFFRGLSWLSLLGIGALVHASFFLPPSMNNIATINKIHPRSFFIVDVYYPIRLYQIMDMNVSSDPVDSSKTDFDQTFRKLLHYIADAYKHEGVWIMLNKVQEGLAYRNDIQWEFGYDYLLKHAENVVCDYVGLSFAMSAMDRNGDAWLFSDDFADQNITAIDVSILRAFEIAHQNTRFYCMMMHPYQLAYFDQIYRECVEEKLGLLMSL